MAVLADSEMIVGDGTTDPVAESGATLRTSIGVGTGDSPQFTGLTLTGDLSVAGACITLTGAATDVDLIDNNACALSFDASGQAGILAIDTQNCAEGVKMSGKLTVTGAISTTGAVTVGACDTGLDVKFFGASAGAYMLYDQSCDQLEIRGASADATTSTGKLLLTTALTDINANDVIGSINFQAPAEAGGTDAIAIAAGIRAVAQATFTCAVNATDLIFYTGHSEAATEKFRFTSQNEIGIAGANYGTDGQVLTSGGAGAAVAWEDAAGGVGCGPLRIANGAVCAPAYSFSADTDTGMYRVGANILAFSGNCNETLRVDAHNKKLYMNDCANGNSSQGMTLNQGAADDEILTLKSSDVAHGLTSKAETDTYAAFKKSSATTGGLRIEGYQEANTRGIDMYSYIGADNTTKSTGASAAGAYTAHRHDCSNGNAAFTANSNIFMMEVVDNGSAAVRFIFDVEGSAHADVEWTTYSDGRLKSNRSDIPYGLDTLKQLEPKIYCRDSGYLDDGTIVLEGTPHRHIGFIAQDVKKLIPEIVKDVCENESWYSLEDGKLTAVVVKAVQELEERVSALEGK